LPHTEDNRFGLFLYGDGQNQAASRARAACFQFAGQPFPCRSASMSSPRSVARALHSGSKRQAANDVVPRGKSSWRHHDRRPPARMPTCRNGVKVHGISTHTSSYPNPAPLQTGIKTTR
jgi:hypothetical protein